MIEQIGNYRIEEKVDDGGIGRIYAARHSLLERRVAIKVLHEHYADDPDFRRRFLQEARAMAALDHPNIARIFDFGEDAGRFFLVMELVEGGSVRSLLRDQGGGPLDPMLAVDLVRQAASGLAYAHNLEMIHRDIKPGNLLLETERDGAASRQPTLKITDFGLVRLADSTSVTTGGIALGTAAYMSPEQCLGRALDNRTDIYSLGVVLFELLTGRLPFEGASAADVADLHVHETPPEPRHLVPAVPDALNAITLRCLAKYPASRYRTCDDLLAALSGLADPGDRITDQVTFDVSGLDGGIDGEGLRATSSAQTRNVAQVDTVDAAIPHAVPVSIEIEPEEVSGTFIGRFRVNVSTDGERTARVELAVDAPDTRGRVLLRPKTVVATPGGIARSKLTILALPRFGYHAQSQQFSVRATVAGKLESSTAGEFVLQPVSSGWMPFAAIGALLALVTCMVAGAAFAAITDTHPFGIGRDQEGSVLVAEGTGQVHRFEPSGDLVRSWSATGDNIAEFGTLSAITVDDAGNLYVVDSGMHRVLKFSNSGELLATWGQPGSRRAQFDQPVDVGIGPEGRVYIVDRGNNRIQVFEADGTFIDEYGGFGSDPGQFDSPNGIAFDRVGNFYVADSGNNRIQKLQSFGRFLISWGGVGSDTGEFDQPLDVAVDDGGNVYVADAGNRRVQKFDFDGRFISSWGAAADGAPGLEDPVAIRAFEERVYVVDRSTGSVIVYREDGSFDHVWPDPDGGTGTLEQPQDVVYVP